MKNTTNFQISPNGKWFAGSDKYCGMFSVILVSILLIACDQEVITPATNGTSVAAAHDEKVMGTAINVVNLYPVLSAQTLWELQQARAATARYRDIRNAIKDNYGDIRVVVENMGYHYMKAAYVDSTFDVKKPEILVYNKNHDGDFELVAVEYAVPLNLSESAPEGFSGTADVWDENEGFGLWLLHAWVWSYNPDGVFHSTNPLVHLH
jgi:hypothetical protein